MSKDEVTKEQEIVSEVAEEEKNEKEEQVSDSEEKVESSDSAEEENQKYLRLAADFQNYKKRAEKEKKDIYAYANEKLAMDLLEVLDNFDRSLEHIDDEGIHMIFKQLKLALSKHDICEMESLGEDFDPNFHHAAAMEATDKYESGKVSDVLKKGYKLKDKVIRPATVKVSE